MFTELKQLLAKRSLTITVVALENQQVRVNVVPHPRPEDKKANEQISYSHKNEVASIPDEAVKALITPISITGSPEEIDEKLPETLLKYVDSHVQLQNSFDQASNEISEAVKAINERNKAKVKDKTNKKDNKAANGDQQPKSNDTLPLWWTDKNAAAPGATEPAQQAERPASTPVPTEVAESSTI